MFHHGQMVLASNYADKVICHTLLELFWTLLFQRTVLYLSVRFAATKFLHYSKKTQKSNLLHVQCIYMYSFEELNLALSAVQCIFIYFWGRKFTKSNLCIQHFSVTSCRSDTNTNKILKELWRRRTLSRFRKSIWSGL